MNLIWGLPKDPPIAAVGAALTRLGQPVSFFDQHDALSVDVDLSMNRQVRGVLRLPDGDVDLSAVTAAYLRPYATSRLPVVAGASASSQARAAATDAALLCWAELTPARVVNRPSAMASNRSKPFQAMLIRAQGFAVPETLLTSDEAALEAFWSLHRRVVYKSTSGIRSIVAELTPAHRERFAHLAGCPTQFQRWIPGIDVRVHVVVDEVFACEIRSPAIDYRYPDDGALPTLETIELPSDVADRCRGLVASMSLLLAGIDLRRTPDGQWFCLEVNPSPGFTYYELATGQPIADAVARMIVAPDEA